LFDVIIPPLFPYFLPLCYPYILLHFKCFLLLVYLVTLSILPSTNVACPLAAFGGSIRYSYLEKSDALARKTYDTGSGVWIPPTVRSRLGASLTLSSGVVVCQK